MRIEFVVARGFLNLPVFLLSCDFCIFSDSEITVINKTSQPRVYSRPESARKLGACSKPSGDNVFIIGALFVDYVHLGWVHRCIQRSTIRRTLNKAMLKAR